RRFCPGVFRGAGLGNADRGGEGGAGGGGAARCGSGESGLLWVRNARGGAAESRLLAPAFLALGGRGGLGLSAGSFAGGGVAAVGGLVGEQTRHRRGP